MDRVLTAPWDRFDPTLTALFATSTGRANHRPTVDIESGRQRIPSEPRTNLLHGLAAQAGNPTTGNPPVDPDGPQSGSYRPLTDPSPDKRVQSGSKIRKRKRGADADDDLETRYLQRLSRTAHAGFGPHDEASSGTIPPPSTETGDEKTPFATHESGPHEILHETLSKESTQTDVEKASRTVFLSNVSIDAVVSRKAKRALLNHLSSFLDDTASPPQTVVSLRFRSVPFSTAAMPKRAAFITKAVMQATTRSTNAYAVYSTASAARLAVTTLNGSVILDRHLRADSVAHPASTDHRRCVFVGNLGFVDDETVMGPKTNQEGETVVEKRKRTKVPMDVEEGLWRTFGRHGGKVESVRVIRDEITRVGKGIAYVQFYDANSVEAALLISGKSFPPLLPRELRVSRCKAPYKTTRAMERTHRRHEFPTPRSSSTGCAPKRTADGRSSAGRTAKLLGRAAASRRDVNAGMTRATGKVSLRTGDRVKSPQSIVFEGRRASASDARSRIAKAKSKRKPGSNTKRQRGKT